MTVVRGLKKLGYGRFLSVSRYRQRKGLPASPCASGALTDEPDWSYPDGRPGQMNKGQTNRYLRDQTLAQSMVDFNKQFETIIANRSKKLSDS